MKGNALKIQRTGVNYMTKRKGAKTLRRVMSSMKLLQGTRRRRLFEKKKKKSANYYCQGLKYGIW